MNNDYAYGGIIPNSSGYIPTMTVNTCSGLFDSMIQHINIKADLGREQLNELGRKAPYHRFVNFPIEVSGVKND